ncbi:ATP-binding cassette domain-containing protein [Actinomadura rubrisoli]|uniref:ATP-binding cassette domain-containing protein n=1 Tax=Actinomadura rubrisoli TaxID=2530368 RepID=A0A4R5C8Z2_9ACTN|nr:ATP-binding cassette domain-containing protein [Actinomadura rubrisoli]TDD94650.1 ATP-binding cassette domain-containing protein [Actinomadura rubrisoli]
MPEPLYVTVRGAVTRLDPTREHSIGGAESCDVRVDVAGLSAPVARLRHIGHWMMIPDPGVEETTVDGEPRAEAVIHLRSTRDVKVTLRLGSSSVDLTLSHTDPAAAPPGPTAPPTPAAEPPTPPAPKPAPPVGWVPSTLRRDGTGTRTHAIGARTVLGNGPGAGIDVPDLGVAAEHATLNRRPDGEFEIRDAGRGAGTFVRGRRVMWARLRPGDSFTIGYSTFTLDGPGALRETRQATGATLVISGLCAAYRTRGSGSRPALQELSAVLRSGEVLAVVGPSGAGKSTLFSALLGEVEVTAGTLLFSGLDLATEAEQIRHMVAFVPQRDDLHDSLTVGQVLHQAARLRLAPGTTPAERGARIQEIARHLEIDHLMRERIRTLSGGERKRVSIGVEILGGPRLLMLDEPTSGLDAGRTRSVMRLLRDIAGNDCTVAVATHSTDQLDGAGKTLVIGSKGRPLYFGDTASALDALGEDDYADLMLTAHRTPEAAAASFLDGPVPREAAALAGTRRRADPPPSLRPEPPRRRVLHQIGVLAGRELALLRARGPLALAQLPGVPALGGVLAALGASPDGLGGGAEENNTPGVQALTILITACVFAGQAITYSDVVSQLPILHREKRAGVSPGAVIAAKALVFGVLAVLQALIAAAAFRLVRPPGDAFLLVGPDTDLALCLSGAALASMSLGLLISASASTLERAVGLATTTAICQVALGGGLLDLSGRSPLSAVSMLLPSRWSSAALAATTDMRELSITAPADGLWDHRTGLMLTELGILLALTAVYACAAWLVLRHRLARRS